MRSILLPVCAIVLSSVLFYALYYSVLRKSRQHLLNRCYLLFTLLFSTLLPFLRLPLPARFPSFASVETVPSLGQNLTGVSAAASPSISIESILHVIYWLGVAVFAVLLLLKVARLLLTMKTEKHSTFGRLIIVENPKQTTPYSFFHFLIINPTSYSLEEFHTICLHEEAHANQLHTVDLLLLEIARIFTWFNPMYLLYKKELRTIHEYLADEAVVSNGTDQTQYLQLMLKQVKTQNHFFLGHPFSAELLKSRIKMIKYEGGAPFAKWKYALIAPLLVAVVILYSAFFPHEAVAQITPKIQQSVSVEITEQSTTDAKPTEPAQKHIGKTKPKPVQSANEAPSQDILSGQTWLNQLGSTVDIGDVPDESQTRVTYNVVVVGVGEDSFSINTTEE